MISINKKFEANASGLVGVELVEDFRHIEIMLRAHTTPDFTVKVKGSLSEYLPDFTATQSAENNWDALQCKDLEDASTIDGDTGFVFDSTDSKMAEVNTNLIRWIGLDITAYTSGILVAELRAR